MSVENFSWVIPNKIAGCALPNFTGRYGDTAAWLAEQGVKVLVSLAMPPGPVEEACAKHDIEWVNYPIPDFDIPYDMHTFTDLIGNIIESMKNDRGVCVHCHAGIGRTGLVLACAVGKYLGLSGDKAVTTVRKIRTAVETPVQKDFTRIFLND